MIRPPSSRRLRIYSFDPSLATRLETALVNETTLAVPWEAGLEKGPVGEYVEVVDYDPAGGCFYAPVDLNDPALLAQDGLAPSEGNPQFHQQMVYAVAMKTIHNFERALGRKALWAPRIERDADGDLKRDGEGRPLTRPVDRLRIYPHALREANAYYSPDKKALLFGYFPAVLTDPGENLPGGLVFTCLSHDVVAHETTHALLDGLHRYFARPSNPDVLALHEAFADIVALFQHFEQPEALRHQIAKTKGDLGSQNLLGELAHQFGQAIGNHGALRDAIGGPDPISGVWIPAVPDPEEYRSTTEPHARGAILVAAMFDAFLAIYRSRIADLLRLATGGSGVLPAGNLHPDLVNRLAGEAAKSAAHVLRIAIRALDYCPPVDPTFGEYLRALITADADVVPDDDRGYRIAFVEAFRRRGIFPRDVRTLAVDALIWEPPDNQLDGLDERLNFADLISEVKHDLFEKGRSEDWGAAERALRSELSERFQRRTHEWLSARIGREADASSSPTIEALCALGLDLEIRRDRGSIYRNRDGRPRFEVHSFRQSFRPTEDGRTLEDFVIVITQRRRGYLDPEVQRRAKALEPDAGEWREAPFEEPDFTMRGGCTLLIDGRTGQIRYAIRKPIASATRLARQRDFVGGVVATSSLHATYTQIRANRRQREPFAALHRGW